MSIEWGPATKTAAERQAAAIRAVATEARHHKLADRAAAGEFTDYSDAHICPITELHRLCRQYGLHELADRVANGDFDATKPESDEWANSASVKEAFAQLPPEMRALFGDPRHRN